MILAEKEKWLESGRTGREIISFKTVRFKMGKCPVSAGSKQGFKVGRDFWSRNRLFIKR